MYQASQNSQHRSFEALVVKWNHLFHEGDVVGVNVTSQSRNPYAANRSYFYSALPFSWFAAKSSKIFPLLAV